MFKQDLIYSLWNEAEKERTGERLFFKQTDCSLVGVLHDSGLVLV